MQIDFKLYILLNITRTISNLEVANITIITILLKSAQYI